jgi:hypothetical protein
MAPGYRWIYEQELKRKTSFYECDKRRVEDLLRQVQPEPVRLRLKQELDHIEIHLSKLRSGLLY